MSKALIFLNIELFRIVEKNCLYCKIIFYFCTIIKKGIDYVLDTRTRFLS
jgi:hypothetical protein